MSPRRFIAAWLPLAVVATALCATVYVAVQQSYRMGADDLPTQLAGDAAADLGRGVDSASIVGSKTVDISTSSAPFICLFDGRGALIATSARIGAIAVSPPKGVIATARAEGIDKVTWQPRPGVRMAIVAIAGEGGEVAVAGRSLREAEAHIDQLGVLTLLGWLAALGGSLVAQRILSGGARTPTA